MFFVIKASDAKRCRSCGFYIQSKILTEIWGTYFFGDSWKRCDTDFDVRFSCTNTTYKDADGNAAGDIVFVLTDCATNKRNESVQDPRYQPSYTPDLGVDTRYSADLQSKPLDSIQTCSRGCYCGYNRHVLEDPKKNDLGYFTFPTRYGEVRRYPSTGIDSSVGRFACAPYEACDRCPDEECGCYPLLIGDYDRFIANRRTHFSAELNTTAFVDSVPLTSKNITMLQYYQVIPCNATIGEGAHGTFDTSKLEYPLEYDISWYWVPDGNTTILLHGYECFADYDYIGSIMNAYTLPLVSPDLIDQSPICP